MPLNAFTETDAQPAIDAAQDQAIANVKAVTDAQPAINVATAAEITALKALTSTLSATTKVILTAKVAVPDGDIPPEVLALTGSDAEEFDNVLVHSSDHLATYSGGVGNWVQDDRVNIEGLKYEQGTQAAFTALANVTTTPTFFLVENGAAGELHFILGTGNSIQLTGITGDINNVSSVADITQLPANGDVIDGVIVRSYHPNQSIGGGSFYWDAARPQTDHDGVFVIAPSATWPVDWSGNVGRVDWYEGVGAAGVGCWIRSNTSVVKLSECGLLPDPDPDTEANAINQGYQLRYAIQTCTANNASINPDVGKIASKDNISGSVRECLITGDLAILGKLDIIGHDNFSVAVASTETTITATAKRNDETISVAAGAAISAGDLIYLLSTEIGATGWSYPKQETHKVARVNGTLVTLEDPLEFDYVDTETTVTIYPKTTCHINSLSIETVSPTLGIFTLKGLAGGDIHNQVSRSANVANVGFSLSQCHGVTTHSLETYKFDYPYILNACRKCVSLKSTHIESRHGISHAVYSADCEAHNVVGMDCVGVVDGHESIRSVFENVHSFRETQGSNARGIGGRFKNVNIYKADTATNSSFLFSTTQFTAFIDGIFPHDDPRNNLDIDGLRLYGPANTSVGIGAYRLPPLTEIKNSIFAQPIISTAQSGKTVRVSDSSLAQGDFRMATEEYERCTFDVSLSSLGRMSAFQGNTTFDLYANDCKFLSGYKGLFGDSDRNAASAGPTRKRTLKNCLVEGLTQTLIGESVSTGLSYEALFINTEFRNCIPSAPAWSATTAYALKDTVQVGNDIFHCVLAGTSGNAAPAWDTARDNTTVDGTANWKIFSISLYGKENGIGYVFRSDNMFTEGTPLPSNNYTPYLTATSDEYADNAAALAGGLLVNDTYWTPAGEYRRVV